MNFVSRAEKRFSLFTTRLLRIRTIAGYQFFQIFYGKFRTIGGYGIWSIDRGGCAFAELIGNTLRDKGYHVQKVHRDITK